MYFKRLELVGFKSFCDKTTLNFGPGITAVVGPNGCGKSNIFDSVRWVLGEQSVKAMRGSDMQDVIFNGTDNKEPLSLAEVSLTFDNQGRYFNLDQDEVCLTRRLFRSGESEYLLNKSPVRLKDILELLMGTGIGAESYSLVAQGKIDLILSSRPEDRRLVFDEAAGITKYKVQKKEAARKLEETNQNLLRVNDIISEVRRQIGSLERQANKARRYKEVFDQLKAKEIHLGLLQRQALLKEKDELAERIKALEARESLLLENIRQQESQIGSQQEELRILESSLLDIRNALFSLNSLKEKNSERIEFNRQRIAELNVEQGRLDEQLGQTKNRLLLDEEKLSNLRREQETFKQRIDEKQQLLSRKQQELERLNLAIKASLDNITRSKKSILDILVRLSTAKNEREEISSQQQVSLARQKRLDLEKLKVGEEKARIELGLSNVSGELSLLQQDLTELNAKIVQLDTDTSSEQAILGQIGADIAGLEKEALALCSQREFLEELKTKYENISEAMNAVIQLDRLPEAKISGLVVKVRNLEPETLKLYGEAKAVELDTRRIHELIASIEERIGLLKNNRCEKETLIQSLQQERLQQEERSRAQEITVANKKALRNNIEEQYNKLRQEEEIIILELQGTQAELKNLSEKLNQAQANLAALEAEHQTLEGCIIKEQDGISLNGGLKEETLVVMAQARTESEALLKRQGSDQATLAILEDTFNQDQNLLEDIQRQLLDNRKKRNNLEAEIKELDSGIVQAEDGLRDKNILLRETEERSREISAGISGTVVRIDQDRKELEARKNSLYELQMRSQEIGFKLDSISQRILQAYQFDLHSAEVGPQAAEEVSLSSEIKALKEKLDSYGTVNLVAIEEYDELKKRYDFLTQQQNDLLSAKEALHEAVLKINRTTRQMFLETFEKIRGEFRNYFRMLFSGGDAQVFLVDEQDPLESGIEIICRPPGKKLQNVLLLSGGEKALSAIALIFAIFKVKPTPFCVLDEIDAALDEANVDRFSRMLQEFTLSSQFIVITHNKRTIAKADVMYGITMEQSGVSRIVSVKFSKDEPLKDSQPEVAVKPA